MHMETNIPKMCIETHDIMSQSEFWNDSLPYCAMHNRYFVVIFPTKRTPHAEKYGVISSPMSD